MFLHCGKKWIKKPIYKCNTNKFIVSPDCVDEPISETILEEIIIVSVKKQVQLIKERKKQLKVLQSKITSNKIDCQNKIKQLEITIENLTNSKFELCKKLIEDENKYEF